MVKQEIDMVITMIESLVALVETFKPELAGNPVVAELQKAIAGIQALGL